MQTAVLGAPHSMEPVYFPPEYEESVQFRYEHDGERFFCGTYLGGCGGELVTRISDYYDIVSHFSHLPDAPVCLYKSTHRAGAAAADHLYIHNGLIRMGARSGRPLKATIDIHTGQCRYILLEDETLALRVQFAELRESAWTEEDRRLTESFETVQWIAGPHASTTTKMLKTRDGYALRSRCRLRDGTREVLVRMDGEFDETEWIPLADCTIDSNGIVTGPALQTQRELHLSAHAGPGTTHGQGVAVTSPPASASPVLSDKELLKLMQPVVEDLLHAMQRGDRGYAKTILRSYREELVLVRRSGLETMKGDLSAVKHWVSGGPAAPIAATNAAIRRSFEAFVTRSNHQSGPGSGSPELKMVNLSSSPNSSPAGVESSDVCTVKATRPIYELAHRHSPQLTDTGVVDSTERDSRDHSKAVCRYQIDVLVPSPDDDVYDDTLCESLFALEVTSPYLPRVGEELNFGVGNRLALSLTVTRVTHYFLSKETVVVAEPQQQSDVTVAQRLLVDPELLVRWAEPLPDVEVVPIGFLVMSAAMYRERHPEVAPAADPNQKPAG
ncbi:hypothetical protein [Nocardia nova]|nr:hypothetical protein [Nocardia nova]